MAKKKPAEYAIGDDVLVLDGGLAQLRAICPGMPPNHHGVVREIWADGSLLVEFDDTGSAAPYPPHLVRPRSCGDGQEKAG